MNSSRKWTPRPLQLRQRAARSGFTLIELMITVAIVGILVAIAFPSYSQHVRTGRRNEVIALMQTMAARQQQFLVDTRSYVGSTALTPVAAAVSASVLGVPIADSVGVHYTLAITRQDGPPPSFAITAVPSGGQSADKCGTLTIDQAGAKTAATSGCW